MTVVCLAIFFGTIPQEKLLAQGLRSNKVRSWENRAGKKIDATLSYEKDGKVFLKLSSGRDAVVLLNSLSDRDQAYLKQLSEQGLSRRIEKMPLETKVDKNVKVEEKPNSAEGGTPVYLTPHFEFHNDSAVSKAFVMEASRIFEGTYEALSALPLGLELKSPEGMTHFKTSFQTRSSFQQTLNGRNLPIPKGNVAGIYISKLKAVFVPYSQMGVKMSGSQMSLRKSSDTSTLIHEITHQLMHDWLPIMPLWMAEGMAEYISAIPYQSGRFDFKNAERGLKDALEKRRRGKEIALPDPEVFLKMRRGIQSGNDYADAMVYVYYFMHLDRPETPGASLAAYLQLLGEGKENAQNLITEFNSAVDDYNAQISNYNIALKKFRLQVSGYKKEIDGYNERIRKHNEFVNQGVDPKGKVEVGKEPTRPKPPKEPVIPEVLVRSKPKEMKKSDEMASKGIVVKGFGTQTDKPKPAASPLFDVYQAANDKAFPSLMRGRDFEKLKSDMIESFKEAGIDVTFR